MEDEEEDEEEEGDAGAVTTTSSFMEIDSTSSSDSLGVVKPGQLDNIVEDAEELVEAASAVEKPTPDDAFSDMAKDCSDLITGAEVDEVKDALSGYGKTLLIVLHVGFSQSNGLR